MAEDYCVIFKIAWGEFLVLTFEALSAWVDTKADDVDSKIPVGVVTRNLGKRFLQYLHPRDIKKIDCTQA